VIPSCVATAGAGEVVVPQGGAAAGDFNFFLLDVVAGTGLGWKAQNSFFSSSKVRSTSSARTPSRAHS
jgi:hypothetical protein